jgi:hypothetical protein
MVTRSFLELGTSSVLEVELAVREPASGWTAS